MFLNSFSRWQRQIYLAVHTSYGRCSISQNLGKIPRSEKNTYLNTRVKRRTRDNNNSLLQTHGPYQRRNHTIQEHKKCLAIHSGVARGAPGGTFWGGTLLIKIKFWKKN